MAYMPFNLPPGFWKNGTPYQSAGRWFQGDRVRWKNGLLRPIGGWRRLRTKDGSEVDRVFNAPDEISRAVISWRANSGEVFTVIGTNRHLYAIKGVEDTTVYDITPAGFTDLGLVPGYDINTGYGGWRYGLSNSGVQRPNFNTYRGFNWAFRLWGENLLALPRGIASTGIYEWALDPAQPATLISSQDAPDFSNAIHVTEQRILMSAGTVAEPRLVKWSDSEDNKDWVPQVSNQAGFQTLPGSGTLVEITELGNEILILSETDLHVCRYIGPPYIFGFDLVGTNCGALSAASVVTTSDFIVWISDSGFYTYNNSQGVQPLRCDVLDYIFSALRSNLSGLLVGVHNQAWNEIWWLLPGPNSNEVDSYVYWNYLDNYWATGTLNRTSACRGPTLSDFFMVSDDGYIYEHELINVPAYDSDPSDVYVESGPLYVNEGNNIMHLSYIVPDFVEQGEVDVTFYCQDRPNMTDTRYGPYVVSYPSLGNSQPVPIRVRGREIKMRVEGKTDMWALGNIRLDGQVGGKR